jgi:hypothetical protein
MKLLEIAPDFVRSEVGSLMTILQMLQNKVEPGTKIPMRNLTNLMNNAGYSFNWEALEGLKKQFPALDELIGDANEDYITIGGKTDDDVGEEPIGEPESDLDAATEPDLGMGAEQPPAPESQQSSAPIGNSRSPERSTVDKMAARASRF